MRASVLTPGGYRGGMTDSTWQSSIPADIYDRYVEPYLNAPGEQPPRDPAPAPFNVVDPKQRRGR